MNESRTLTVDHLRAWVRHCEEQGENTVVGETMSRTRCLGARTLLYSYATQWAWVNASNTYAYAASSEAGIDDAVTPILDTFDRCLGKDEDGYYVEAPVTIAMLRETSVWGMLFPEEEKVS